MKRIIALILAVMMLCGMAAFAEEMPTAAVLELSNFNVTVSGGGQTQTHSLKDLNATLILDTADLPTLVLSVADGENALAQAYGQVKGSQFLFTMDGMNCAYAEDIPQQALQNAQIPVEQLPMVFQMLVPALDEVVIPPLSGVSIPKVDASAVLGAFMNGNEFTIPSEVIYAVIEQVIQLGSANMPADMVSQISSAIGQLKASGAEISITGTVNDDGMTQTVDGSVVVSMSGQTLPIANINMTSQANDLLLTLGADLGTGSMGTLLTVKAVSDPATSEVSITMDIAGMATLGFGAFVEDGLQKFTMDMGASGESVSMEFGYGQQNGRDIVLFNMSAGSSGSYGMVIDSAMGGDGVRTGTVTLNTESYGQTVTITGDMAAYLGSADLQGFTMPADVRPMSELDQEEVSRLFQPVADYISGQNAAA